MNEIPNFCLKCGALDVEWAREACTNPVWHIPNFNQIGREEEEPD